MLLKKYIFILLIKICISYKFLNTNIPFCINCIHFIKDKTNNAENGKCKLFGTIDPITGYINYQYASMCRKDINNMCGIQAKYFRAVKIKN